MLEPPVTSNINKSIEDIKINNQHTETLSLKVNKISEVKLCKAQSQSVAILNLVFADNKDKFKIMNQ